MCGKSWSDFELCFLHTTFTLAVVGGIDLDLRPRRVGRPSRRAEMAPNPSDRRQENSLNKNCTKNNNLLRPMPPQQFARNSETAQVGRTEVGWRKLPIAVLCATEVQNIVEFRDKSPLGCGVELCSNV